MEKSLFRFIWRYSKRDQLILLAITILSFPILYLSLELPKRIINDAIGGSGNDVSLLGITFSQVQFLFILCICFLLTVLANGLLKMRINTMKGVLAERLLRRFRFQLLTRISRFPRPYFRTTSQGELVSMVTSEAEPMGGLMGDMISQPILQAGQMLTILVFLFAQSFWFGLASIALIPFQAWIIPKLQRQINLLHMARIKEVRRLASDIGETAAGVSDIRTNGGLRHRMSLFSMRLGNLFGIRFEIYQKKFFMKFLNNFINQLTPFFFYAVGGYLVIIGEISIGALIAALAAFKDLSSPWKELLAYYNQTQDMALQWEVVTERFAPQSLVKDSLFEGAPETIKSLAGDIEIENVTVTNQEGQPVLEDINLTIPRGARVAVQTNRETVALAFADLLTREVIPQRGTVQIAGNELNELHQSVIANRIGYAHSKPHLFKGTLGENLLMPLKYEPADNLDASDEMMFSRQEAARTGNSADLFDDDWNPAKVNGLESIDNIREWWFELTGAMGTDDFMVRLALRSRLDPGTHPELEEAIVRMRPEIEQRLKEAGMEDIVLRFHPEKFNSESLLGSNLLYAHPTQVLTQKALASDPNFLRMLKNAGIEEEIAQMSRSLIDGLTTTFGNDGTKHPLFRRLGMDEELYSRLGNISARSKEVGDAGLSSDDFALLVTVPFAFSAEQIGPVFSEKFKQRVLQIRLESAAQMVEEMDGLFQTIDPQRYIPTMTVLGNSIFGRISSIAGARKKKIEDVVVDVLTDHGLRRLVAQSVFDIVTTQGGENLPSVYRERAAVSRAGIKKPDILILGNALASHDEAARELTRERISHLMPETTKIFIEKKFPNPEAFDMFVDLGDGKIKDHALPAPAIGDFDADQDLKQKLQTISKAELFADLDRSQQRLLAFSSRWYNVEADQTIYTADQDADAAYLCVKGLSGLYWAGDGRNKRLVTEVAPGRLVGDLSVILKERRKMDLVTIEDSVFLRIDGKDLLAVIENDVKVASSLLRTVAGHLTSAATNSRNIRDFAIERGVDFSEMENKD